MNKSNNATIFTLKEQPILAVNNQTTESFSEQVDYVFQDNMKKCFSTFCFISQPIVSDAKIQVMVDDYKNNFLLHCSSMISVLNLCHKS